MTLRTRLMLTWAAIIGLFVVTSLYGVSRLTHMRGIAEDLQGQDARASLALGRLQTSLAEIDRLLRSYVATGDGDDDLRLSLFAKLDEARTLLGQLRTSGYDKAVEGTSTRLSALREQSQELVSMVEAGHKDRATSYLEPVKDAITETQNSLSVIADAIDRRSESRVDRAKSISDVASTTSLIALIVASIVAIGLGLWTTKALTDPLHRLRGAMAVVADGEFGEPGELPYERTDEIGDLSRSFRTMAGKLAELDRMKAEFISVASHELKTPLNVIGGYAELLEDGVYGDVTPGQREALDSIRDQTRVLTDLVNQILDISRIEAGGFRTEVMDVESQELFEAVRRMFEPLAKQKRVGFVVDIADDFPHTLRVDPDRLRNEVLGNLLSNAFKFTPEGGEVRVEARPAGDGQVLIEVCDTGSGIPEEQLDFIFEKFYQVGQEARVKGSGLGLAIAREIVEAHGGTIAARRGDSRGTVFSIRLPVGGAPA